MLHFQPCCFASGFPRHAHRTDLDKACVDGAGEEECRWLSMIRISNMCRALVIPSYLSRVSRLVDLEADLGRCKGVL